MAISFLPPIIPSPFGKAFSRHPYHMTELGGNSSTDGQDCCHHSPGSPIQSSKTVSAPATPSAAQRFKHVARILKSRCQYERRVTLSDDTENFASRLLDPRSGSSNTEAFPLLEDPFTTAESQPEALPGLRVADPLANLSWACPLSCSANAASASSQALRPSSDTAADESCSLYGTADGPRTASRLSGPVEKRAGNFRRWASTFRLRRGEDQRKLQARTIEETLRIDTASPLPAMPLRPYRHRKRTSNASSRFITTVKTASLSNDSMSLLQCSQRQSRVSDMRFNRGSDPRPSSDSQRPSSIVSTDEGALKRSMMRRRILQEILESEESFVADLKALHNLFSTLLVSLPSITIQARTSIQRNVADMLQLHEYIVSEIHRTSKISALREWKNAACTSKSNRRMRGTLQRLEAPLYRPSSQKLDQKAAQSIFTKLDSRGALGNTADAVEAADVARIFREQLPRFSVYQEYCARYELMVQEVAHSHRAIPQWPCYESGMEALARSVASLRDRANDSTKGFTTADLLMKPIQRVCKYPLLLADLHQHTPVTDCPTSHAVMDEALSALRGVVQDINLATNDPGARDRMQRRWLLQDRLGLGPDTLQPFQFRMLGHAVLCGVLHVAHCTPTGVEGGYMLCIMFRDYLVIANPTPDTAKFDIAAVILLSDAKIRSPEDGRGLQCHTVPFSWKIVFDCRGPSFELLFSACSAAEQQQWLAGIKRGRSLLVLERPVSRPSVPGLFTKIFLNTKPLGPIGQVRSFTKRSSMQRAATMGTRSAACQVIIRNTCRPEDGQESQESASRAINRSQSLLSTHRVSVLSAKRIERVRLERSLADVWTRDTLPYPGMLLPRGGNLIRTSAGSLARKLSFASMHTPFTKRSASLTLVGSRFSHDTYRGTKDEIEEEEVVLAKHGKLFCQNGVLGGVSEKCQQSVGKGCGSTIICPSPRLSFATIDRPHRYRNGGGLGVSSGSGVKRELRLSTPVPRSRSPSLSSSSTSSLLNLSLGRDHDSFMTIAGARTAKATRNRWSNRLRSQLKKRLSAEGVRQLFHSARG